jgi:beta-lactamase superfamily II metal-dependent hydrolase
MVEAFYELKYIRRTGDASSDSEGAVKETLELTLASKASTPAFEGSLVEGSVVRINNTGTTVLEAYFATSPTATSTNVTTIDVGQLVSLTATATDKVLIIKNTDVNEGRAVVELL